MLKTTITVFLAVAAAVKNSRTGASLYFCCVSTATITSQALRTSLARWPFSRSVPSMSGVSIKTSRVGCWPLGSSRQMSRWLPASAGKLSSPYPSMPSCGLLHGTVTNSGKSSDGLILSAIPRGRLATGKRVRAASGTEQLIWLPISALVIRLLPVLVPPQTAATKRASPDTWGASLSNSCPYHSVRRGSGTPSDSPNDSRAVISLQSA